MVFFNGCDEEKLAACNLDLNETGLGQGPSNRLVGLERLAPSLAQRKSELLPGQMKCDAIKENVQLKQYRPQVASGQVFHYLPDRKAPRDAACPQDAGGLENLMYLTCSFEDMHVGERHPGHHKIESGRPEWELFSFRADEVNAVRQGLPVLEGHKVHVYTDGQYIGRKVAPGKCPSDTTTNVKHACACDRNPGQRALSTNSVYGTV